MAFQHLRKTAPEGAERKIEPMRSAVAADIGEEEDDTAQLAGLLSEIRRQQAADGVLVAWHDGGERPLLLFGDGQHDPRSAAERGMVVSASAAARACAQLCSAWSDCGSVDGGALYNMSMPSHGGIITVTTFFAQISKTSRLRVRDAAARLLPIMQPFFSMWGRRRGMMTRLRGLTAAVNNSDLGILLVDRNGRQLFANAAANAIVQQKDGLRLTAGSVSGAKMADTVRLLTAIEHVFDADHSLRSGGGAPVVPLYRADRRPLLCTVMRADQNISDPHGGTAVLYLIDPEQSLANLVAPACELYGLSPVETRLTCLLADGVSLIDAAARMRLREQTARTYLKQIFGKTQTSRQAELVWLMLKSSVRIAPGCLTTFV